MTAVTSNALPCASSETQLARELAGVQTDTPFVVFDLDGTLYDTRDFERPALMSVVDWLSSESGRSLPGLAGALIARREADRHRPGLFNDMLVEYGLPAEWGAECARRFHDYPGTELARSPSLQTLLRSLRADGKRLAVVSNGYAELQTRKLAQLGLADLFEHCVICNPRRPHELKPSRWAWEQLEGWRGGAPAVHVGDDPVDAGFAAAGGARFIPFCFRSASYDH